MNLENECILITGASSGLGWQFAKMLGARGAKIALAARRRDRLESLQQELENQGIRVCSIAMDVADERSVARGFDEASHTLGPITGAIANAGMNIEGSALRLSADKINQLLSVNVQGAFLTAREAARHMIDSQSERPNAGKIVLISSITAAHVSRGIALYSASKAAVVQLGKCLAADWSRKGINVNVVCPGYVQTSLNQDWFQTSSGQKQIDEWPRKRLMSAPDLDGILHYLMSPASEKTTGSVFTVDDGQTLS